MDIIDRAQQQKLSVQRVNPVPVATQCAKIVLKEHSKVLQVKQSVSTAPVAGAIPATDRPGATPYHRGRTR